MTVARIGCIDELEGGKKGRKIGAGVGVSRWVGLIGWDVVLDWEG